MSNNNTSATGGIGVLGVLGCCFVVLKLVEIINWSWWLVLLPFYGGFVLLLVAFIVFMIITSKRRK